MWLENMKVVFSIVWLYWTVPTFVDISRHNSYTTHAHTRNNMHTHVNATTFFPIWFTVVYVWQWWYAECWLLLLWKCMHIAFCGYDLNFCMGPQSHTTTDQHSMRHPNRVQVLKFTLRYCAYSEKKSTITNTQITYMQHFDAMLYVKSKCVSAINALQIKSKSFEYEIVTNGFCWGKKSSNQQRIQI